MLLEAPDARCLLTNSPKINPKKLETGLRTISAGILKRVVPRNRGKQGSP